MSAQVRRYRFIWLRYMNCGYVVLAVKRPLPRLIKSVFGGAKTILLRYMMHTISKIETLRSTGWQVS